jgi:large subunit ribosomal protein L15
MPLIRRVPKRGFVNPFREPAQVVNLYALARLPEASDVTPETLLGAGLVGRSDRTIKLLAQGEPDRAFVVRGVQCSEAARAKLEAAGGRVEA